MENNSSKNNDLNNNPQNEENLSSKKKIHLNQIQTKFQTQKVKI
jgi:hypothetical protein